MLVLARDHPSYEELSAKWKVIEKRMIKAGKGRCCDPCWQPEVKGAVSHAGKEKASPRTNVE